ncbi:hypothetical protein LTR37_020786 [Vermiconidia calcicola]|uniref:Uncharacterized protein n=1 Tax=Vermiconidia calcicola TaxID=1690605 RepID=A0ACC3MBN3_9PEZI|nr:hypothetical protein LTR37_020786 [Vermiconidia calcicola]
MRTSRTNTSFGLQALTYTGSVTLNSDVNFTVIVNPESGPGSGVSPGDDYVSAIQRLNAIPNVRTVGYVRTGYGDRDIDTVTREVATYSGWSQLNNSLSIMGIFFDEAPHEWTLERQRYLSAANQAVEDAAGIRQPKLIIHNPGTPPDPRLDDSRTDIIVAFESPFDSFQDRQSDLKSLSGDRSSYSFMVLDVPEGENMRKLVQKMSRQARYLFVTTANQGYYEHFSDSWAEFTSIMAA